MTEFVISFNKYMEMVVKIKDEEIQIEKELRKKELKSLKNFYLA